MTRRKSTAASRGSGASRSPPARGDDAKVLAGLIDLSLPRKGEPLRDWQAVVLGGGVINGLSLEGKWPGKRLAELLARQPRTGEALGRDAQTRRTRWPTTRRFPTARATTPYASSRSTTGRTPNRD